MRALLLAASASPSGLRESKALAAVPVVAAALAPPPPPGGGGGGGGAAALPRPAPPQPEPLAPFTWLLLRNAADALLRASAPGAEVLIAPAHALVASAILARYGAGSLGVARRALAAWYEEGGDSPRRATEAPALYAALGDRRALARSLCCDAVARFAAGGEAAMNTVLRWARAAGEPAGTYDAAAGEVEAWAGTLRWNEGLDADGRRAPTLLHALTLLRGMSRVRQAAPLWRKLVEGAAALLADGGPLAADILVTAASASRRGAGAGAVQDLAARAVAIRARHFGEHLLVAEALLVQAEHLKDTDLRGEPEGEGPAPLYARALAIAETMPPRGFHPLVASILGSEGYWLLRRGELKRAHACWERGLAIQTTAYGPSHSSIAATHFCEGDAYRAENNASKAADHQRAALAIRLEALGEDHGDVATLQHNLAYSLRALGRREEAADLCRRALATRRKLQGGRGHGVAATLESLAALLRDGGAHEEAARAFEGALEAAAARERARARARARTRTARFGTRAVAAATRRRRSATAGGAPLCAPRATLRPSGACASCAASAARTCARRAGRGSPRATHGRTA